MTDFTKLSDQELTEALNFHRRQRNMSRGINEAAHARQTQMVRILEAEEARRLEEAEGSVKKNRELLATGRISKDEFDRRMGYGKYKSKGPAGVGPLGKSLYKNLVKTNEEVELSEAETNYVIKHKKTKQVLNTHSDYATAKDEHEGLGADKHEYGIYKQTKKDAALRNRNTYREEVELEENFKEGDKVSFTTDYGTKQKGVITNPHTRTVKGKRHAEVRVGLSPNTWSRVHVPHHRLEKVSEEFEINEASNYVVAYRDKSVSNTVTKKVFDNPEDAKRYHDRIRGYKWAGDLKVGPARSMVHHIKSLHAKIDFLKKLNLTKLRTMMHLERLRTGISQRLQ